MFDLFAKIRQNYTSYNRHQGPLDRAGFCHLFYSIPGPERLPECEYEGRFSGGSQKSGNIEKTLAGVLRERTAKADLHRLIVGKPVGDHVCRPPRDFPAGTRSLAVHHRDFRWRGYPTER